METKKAIEERRSIRNFSKQVIDKEIVEDIVKCGTLAPSAKNRQPWFFLIVSGEVKNNIADLMISYSKSNDVENERKNTGHKSSVYATARVIVDAPILILVFKEINNNWIVGDNLSIGACIENMCLRATDLGLGTLWIRDTVFVSKEIAHMVGYDNLELNCALALGYYNVLPKAKPRKKLEYVMKWY